MKRATREEEWPLLKESHDKEVMGFSKLTAEIASRELEDAKRNHARALEDKGRTTRITPPLKQYLSDLMIRVDKDCEAWARRERDRADAQAAREAEQGAIREAEEAREREQREEGERLLRERAEAEQREAEEAARRAREAVEREEAERKRAASVGRYKPGAFRRMKTGPAGEREWFGCSSKQIGKGRQTERVFEAGIPTILGRYTVHLKLRH